MNEKDMKTELQVFDQHLASWLKTNEGQFVLIRGSDVEGFYTTYPEALSAGYEKFGVAPFLVQKIAAPHEEVQHVSRLSTPTAV